MPNSVETQSKNLIDTHSPLAARRSWFLFVEFACSHVCVTFLQTLIKKMHNGLNDYFKCVPQCKCVCVAYDRLVNCLKYTLLSLKCGEDRLQQPHNP